MSSCRSELVAVHRGVACMNDHPTTSATHLLNHLSALPWTAGQACGLPEAPLQKLVRSKRQPLAHAAGPSPCRDRRCMPARGPPAAKRCGCCVARAPPVRHSGRCRDRASAAVGADTELRLHAWCSSVARYSRQSCRSETETRCKETLTWQHHLSACMPREGQLTATHIDRQ